MSLWKGTSFLIFEGLVEIPSTNRGFFHQILASLFLFKGIYFHSIEHTSTENFPPESFGAMSTKIGKLVKIQRSSWKTVGVLSRFLSLPVFAPGVWIFCVVLKYRGETGEALPVEEEQVGSDLFLLGWHLGIWFPTGGCYHKFGYGDNEGGCTFNGFKQQKRNMFWKVFGKMDVTVAVEYFQSFF